MDISQFQNMKNNKFSKFQNQNQDDPILVCSKKLCEKKIILYNLFPF
jgi:hypothetical protein